MALDGWKPASASSQLVREMLRLYIAGHARGNYTRNALGRDQSPYQNRVEWHIHDPDYMCQNRPRYD